jgi:hypothetical protein
LLTAIIYSSTNEGVKIIEAVKMLATRIYTEIHQVDARLIPFGVTRQELTEIVRGVVGARADAVENDPMTAEGQFAYIFGTRFVRSLFRTKGWHLHRENNIESVSHPNRVQRIIYQSVDLAASKHHKPQAVSGKKAGSARIIAEAQGSLFTEQELEKLAKSKRLDTIDTGVWYFCVSVNGDDVRAELSLPTGVEGDNFKGFIERIFIVRDGEWPDLSIKPDTNDAAEFEPIVTRK